MEKKKASVSKWKYIDRYNKTKMTPIAFRFSKKTDADILEHLNKQPNRSKYIKELIRADMNKGMK